MAQRKIVTRDQILDVAYQMAREGGLGALGTRDLASRCDMAVGTLYNHYPDKAELVCDVIGRFWSSALRQTGLLDRSEPGAGPIGTVEYCRRLADGLSQAVASFRDGWLAEISSLDPRTRGRTRAAQRECFSTIVGRIAQVVRQDPLVCPEARDALSPDDLARVVWDAIYGELSDPDGSCDTLLDMLSLALYGKVRAGERC